MVSNIKAGLGIEHESHFVKRDGTNFRTKELTSGNPNVETTGDSSIHEGVELVTKKFNETPKNLSLELMKTVRNSGEYKIAPFGNVLGTDMSNPGSYHINITMPYDESKLDSETYVKDYNMKLIQGMRNIRWVEPLILAVMGSSSQSAIGKPEFPEGSIRQYSNTYSNVGLTGLDDDSILNSEGNRHKLKDWMDRYFKSRRYATAPPGKYDNKNKTFSMNKNLDNRIFNSSRAVGDFTIKGYVEKKYPANNNIKTIELRMPDTFDSRGIYSLTKFVLYCMINSDRTQISKDATNYRVWANALREAVEEGWNSQISIEYFKQLKKEMKLDIVLPSTKTLRADIGLDLIAKDIYRKNKSSIVAKHWKIDDGEIELHTFNRSSWEYNFKLYAKQNNNGLKDKTETFLKSLGSIKTTASNGWMNVEIKNSKLTIRDLITRDFGLVFTLEDYRDILFLLETHGVIELKTVESGEIDKIKLKRELKTDEDVKNVMNDILDISDYFSNDYGLLSYTNTRTSTPTPTPTPTPISEEEPELVTIQTPPPQENIDSSGFQYLAHSSEQSEDIKNTFEDVIFNAFEFFDWNINIVKYIRINSVAQNYNKIFWIRDDNKIDVFINKDSFSEDDDVIEAVKKIIKNKWYRSDGRVGVPTSDSQEQFLNKLKLSFNELMGKNRTNIIPFNNAGMKTLERLGVHIGSVKSTKDNRREYVLVNKNNIRDMKKFKDFRIIKSIPYYRNYRAEKIGNKIIFYKDMTKFQTLQL